MKKIYEFKFVALEAVGSIPITRPIGIKNAKFVVPIKKTFLLLKEDDYKTEQAAGFPR